MDYQKLLQLVEDSKFIEALDKILIIVEGNDEDLYKSAIYLKRRVKRLESDFLNGLVDRDYYDVKQNQLAMPIMDLIIETSEVNPEGNSIYHLNILAKRMSDSFSTLKRRIIQNKVKDGEIVSFLVDEIIIVIQDFIHPKNSKNMGKNPFKNDCSDFIFKLLERKKKIKKEKEYNDGRVN